MTNWPGDTHCDDAALLAYADHEVPARTARAIRKHLGGCWKCRARLEEIEERVCAIARLVDADHYPDPGRVAAARARLMGRMWQLAARPAHPVRPWSRLVLWAAASLVTAVGLTAFLGTRHREPSLPKPHPLLSEVARTEASAIQTLSSRGTVYQAFRIVAARTRPEGPRRESRLEIWSDPTHERFTSRWKDSSGVLRHALWRPRPDRSYAYTGAGARTWNDQPEAARDQPLPDLLPAGLSLDILEQAFLRWLERRRWEPVSLVDGVRQFASRDGATLAVEAVRDDRGQPCLRLRAAKAIEGGQVMFDLVVAQDTRRPRLQSVICERYGQTYQLELIADEQVGVAHASFEPEARLIPGKTSVAGPAARLVPESLPATKEEPAALQVEAMYVLHRLKACTGEGVEVVRDGDAVVVRGTVGTQSRKEELAAGLALLAETRGLKVAIESADEAMARISHGPGEGPRQTLIAPRSTLDPDGAAQHPWCRGMTVKACAQRRARVLVAVGSIVTEAAELRGLDAMCRRHGAPGTVPSGPEKLLVIMIREHLDGLRARSAEFWRLLGDLAPEPHWMAAPAAVEISGRDYGTVYEAARDLSRQLHLALAENAPSSTAGQAVEVVTSASRLQAMLDRLAAIPSSGNVARRQP